MKQFRRRCLRQSKIIVAGNAWLILWVGHGRSNSTGW
jgi:hypothetical protein